MRFFIPPDTFSQTQGKIGARTVQATGQALLPGIGCASVARLVEIVEANEKVALRRGPLADAGSIAMCKGMHQNRWLEPWPTSIRNPCQDLTT